MRMNLCGWALPCVAKARLADDDIRNDAHIGCILYMVRFSRPPIVLP